MKDHQPCLHCAPQIEHLQRQLAYLEKEHAGTLELYAIESRNRRKAELSEARLRKELNGSTTPETAKIKKIIEHHDAAWRRLNPNARGLSYPMDGANVSKVRKMLRWGKDVEWICRAIDGAFTERYRLEKPSSLLTLESILRDENKAQRNYEAWERRALNDGLRAAREEKRAATAEPIDRVLQALESRGLPWCVPPRSRFEANLWLSVCPSCNGELEVRVNEFDCVNPVCGSCEFTVVLAALGLGLEDLWRRWDPGLEMAA